MDALALLCNLHAEGPRTLQRLRRISCESLTALLQADPAELARELDQDEAGALRFQREAELLRERLAAEEGSSAGRNPSSGASRTTASSPTPDSASGHEEPQPAVSLPTVPPAASASPGIDRVLETWRSLDESQPPRAPEEYVVPRPTPAPGNRGLDESSLDGLSAGLVEELAEVGILSLHGLVEADTLALGRAIDRPFTVLRRLQSLAQRELERLPSAPDPAQLESAGPFA